MQSPVGRKIVKRCCTSASVKQCRDETLPISYLHAVSSVSDLAWSSVNAEYHKKFLLSQKHIKYLEELMYSGEYLE